MIVGSGGGSGVVGAGSAALRAAASSGDATACAKLLGSARTVRFSRDELGRSALHLAASAGHAPIVRLLLSVAAPREADAPDGSGCTALQRAAADGHESVVRLLLARGADVDRHDSVHCNCAVHEAAWKGYSRTVALLASAGANLTKTNAGGFTPLHLCCQNGHNQSCRELLLAGCNPDLQNNYGDTALHTAARYGHAGVTRILISANCRISEQNKNGDTSLHIAAAMGRRKLTRILAEAGCDKAVQNKQGETARDIALRKDLNEILNILDERYPKKENKSKAKKKLHAKGKVRFDGNIPASSKNPIRSKNWSPYGCHYYPDPEAFPSPRLETLPDEPLKRGEQYYLDLAGHIRKGPVGVGYTCYCAPLFRHLEARLEKDKRELQRAQMRLGQRVAGLEQKLNRGAHGRRSERVVVKRNDQVLPVAISRSRSLDVLDRFDDEDDRLPAATRSMEELEQGDSVGEELNSRPSVRDLVARIQQYEAAATGTVDNSESSSGDEDEDEVQPMHPGGTMGNFNPSPDRNPNYENVPNGIPRSRMGVYNSSHMARTPASDVQSSSRIETSSRIRESAGSTPNTRMFTSCARIPIQSARQSAEMDRPQVVTYQPVSLYHEQSADTRFAKLRMLDNTKVFGGARNEFVEKARMLDSEKMFESTARMLENRRDAIDRDTNNDSGYSTKVYGSSKGNSPCLSGQTDNECLAASSLV